MPNLVYFSSSCVTHQRVKMSDFAVSHEVGVYGSSSPGGEVKAEVSADEELRRQNNFMATLTNLVDENDVNKIIASQRSM